MAVTDRNSFRLYCLTKLGYPAIQIDVESTQVEDRIDDAIQYFIEQHVDGVNEGYYLHTITSTDMSNEYITITDPLVISVVDLINYDAEADNLLSVKFQVKISDVYDLSRGSVLDYALTQNHIALLDWMFQTQPKMRYNKSEGNIYIDTDWSVDYSVGQILVFRVFRAIDPGTASAVWNERQLKEYATALIGRQWGQNLSKYSGVSLPGGVKLDGQAMFEKWDKEKERIEQEIQRWPMGFFMG